MHSVTGFMFTLDNKNGALLEYGSLLNYDFSLGNGRVWTIALDQSTTCTGIAIIDNAGEYGAMLDVKRDSLLPASDYKKALSRFVRRLTANQTITELIMERPVPHAKFRTSRDKLHELKGTIDSWQESIPAFENTKFYDVLPNVWRAGVMDKSKGTGRTKSKYAIAEDVSDKFPVTKSYLEVCPATDYDSFEALGIYAGYKVYAYTPDGVPMICGTEEKNHVSFVGYMWVDRAKCEEAINTVVNDIPCGRKRIVTRAYNPKYNFHKNVRMASSGWPEGLFTLVPENQLEQFRWKFGIDPSDTSKVLVVFVFKKRLLTRADIEHRRMLFNWTEDITSI